METHYAFQWQIPKVEQEDFPFDQFTSNYEDMIVSIISWTHDPKISYEPDYGDFE